MTIYLFDLLIAVNTVTLLGRVGAEPQKRGNEEHPVVTFSVATHNNYRLYICFNIFINKITSFFDRYENGDWAQRTDWHRIVVFKPSLRDAVMSYLHKGQRTLVTGKITYGEITDQEGKPRLATSIIADDVVFFQNTNSNK